MLSIEKIFRKLTTICLYKAANDKAFLDFFEANIPIEKPFIFYHGVANWHSTTFYVLE
jgi:hypothetical protein